MDSAALTIPDHRHILGMRVDGTSYADAVDRVLAWARDHQSRYVCVATAHTVMEAYDSAEFRHIVNGADLVTPDGMPLVWGLRWLGVKEAVRVYGPEHINRSGARILFVGLGCPKQEWWMAARRGRRAVMLGVGAAFDFLAGVKPRVPSWMQRAGLEWFFRLDLAAKMQWAATHPREMAAMGRQARREFERRYSAEQNYRMLMAMYETAIQWARR